MDRRTAVASQLLKRAGVTGDHMSLAGSLPRETLDQFDKVMRRRDPTVPRTAGGIMSFAEGGGVPKDKPRSPVGQGVYGLGDVEYRAALDPQFTDVVSNRGEMEDDYVGLLGLRALEQKHNYDYGKFIDADARRLDEDFSRNIGVLGDYDPGKDQLRIKTTPTEYQRQDASENPEVYNAYFSRDRAGQTTAHELFHAGSQRLDTPRALWVQHTFLKSLDWERLNKTDSARNVARVLRPYSPKYVAYQKKAPEVSSMWRSNRRRMQDEAREKYEALGPPRVKLGDGAPEEPGFFRSIINRFADGGAVEPRPTDLGSEMMAIQALIREEDDPEVLRELYARLEQLQAQVGPPLSVGSDGFSVIPQFDAAASGGESNRSVPSGDGRINIADETMGGIARLGASFNFPGGNLTGGVTGVHDKTTRRFPDELQAQGAPKSVEYGNQRGFVPTNYDLSGTYGPHTGTVNVQPRREGADRDAIGGRSVFDLGYEYRPSEDESFSINATPFGRRVVKNYKTGETEMDRSIRVQYNRRF